MATVDISRIGQITIFTLNGRMDSISAAHIQARLMELTGEERKRLILNMENVTYISAAGLRILRRLGESTGEVNIAAPSDRVVEVMQITGLDVVYKLHRTQIGAIHTQQPILNAHTHLELSALSHLCPPIPGKNFVDWIIDDIDKTLQYREHDWSVTYTKAIEAAIEQLIAAGITVIGDVSHTGLSIQPLANSGLRGIVYIEMLGTNPIQIQSRFNDVCELIDKWRHIERSDGIHLGISLHAPYSVHPELWRIGLEYAEKENLPLCIHVAETADEYEFFMKGTGKLVEKYYSDGFPAVESPHMSPVAYLETMGVLAQKPLLVHGVHVDDEDITRIKNAGATVVHCPRSNLRLNAGRMPLEKYLEQGVPVLMGSESLASAPTLNVFDDIEIAAALHHEKVKAEQIMTMVHGTLPGLDL